MISYRVWYAKSSRLFISHDWMQHDLIKTTKKGENIPLELPACAALSVWVGWGRLGWGWVGPSSLSELPKGDLHSADQGCSWVQIIALSFSACHRDILAICCKLSLMSRKSGPRGLGGGFSSADLTHRRCHVEIRSTRLLQVPLQVKRSLKQNQEHADR